MDISSHLISLFSWKVIIEDAILLGQPEEEFEEKEAHMESAAEDEKKTTKQMSDFGEFFLEDSDLHFESQGSTQEMSNQRSTQEVNARLRPRQRRPASQFSGEGSNEESDHDDSFGDGQSGQPRRTRRIRKSKGRLPKKPYPTKNFLATFKGPHLEWLERFFGQQIYKHPIIAQILSKFGISMKDYERLYKIGEFKKVWEKMFDTAYLFRALMISRCQEDARREFVKKIYVFKKAFLEEKFERIN